MEKRPSRLESEAGESAPSLTRTERLQARADALRERTEATRDAARARAADRKTPEEIRESLTREARAARREEKRAEREREREKREARIDALEESGEKVRLRDRLRQRTDGLRDLGETPRELDRRSVLTGALSLLMVGGAGAAGLSVNAMQQERDRALAADAKALAETQEALAALPEPVDPAVLSEQARERALAAHAAAEIVATEQNRFAEIIYDNGDTSYVFEDDTLAPWQNAAAAQRVEMAKYFDPASFTDEDENILRYDAFYVYRGEEIDPRYPWFIWWADTDGRHPHPNTEYGWSVVSTVPDLREGSDTTQVLWLNRASSGTLLAWARATYLPSTGLFTALQVGRTTQGTLAITEMLRSF